MYFRNRAEAGRRLATKLESYRSENVAILALSPGSVIIGAQVAMHLHSNMTMLLTESIHLPGETDSFAFMSSGGNFMYNNMFSAGEIEELVAEYHGYIADQRLMVMHRINSLLSHDGEINRDRLRNKTVILISDGLSNGFSLDIAAEFFKTVAIKSLVIAVPVASMSAVDRMHLLGDRIFCLSVVDNFVSTNHYYEDNTIPQMSDMFKVMKNIALYWERPREEGEFHQLKKIPHPVEALVKAAAAPAPTEKPAVKIPVKVTSKPATPKPEPQIVAKRSVPRRKVPVRTPNRLRSVGSALPIRKIPKPTAYASPIYSIPHDTW